MRAYRRYQDNKLNYSTELHVLTVTHFSKPPAAATQSKLFSSWYGQISYCCRASVWYQNSIRYELNPKNKEKKTLHGYKQFGKRVSLKLKFLTRLLSLILLIQIPGIGSLRPMVTIPMLRYDAHGTFYHPNTETPVRLFTMVSWARIAILKTGYT